MFFSQYFSFPCQYHSTNAPYSFILHWHYVILGTNGVDKTPLSLSPSLSVFDSLSPSLSPLLSLPHSNNRINLLRYNFHRLLWRRVQIVLTKAVSVLYSQCTVLRLRTCSDNCYAVEGWGRCGGEKCMVVTTKHVAKLQLYRSVIKQYQFNFCVAYFCYDVGWRQPNWADEQVE